METDNLNFIHHYIPAKDAPQAITLLLLHGTGGDENALLDLGRMLDPHANMLSPRGKVLEHGMPRFFRRFAEGVLDVEDLKMRSHELADFVTAASAAYGFDARHVIPAGFSNGANIAASMLLLRPEVLQAAILYHPMVPFVPQALPDLTDKPVFIGAGRADPLVPQAQTEQLIDLLQRSGAHVTTFWQPGGHTVSHEEVRATREWLNTLKSS